MRDRAFGVEIECGFRPSNTRTEAWYQAQTLLANAAHDGLINPYWAQHMGRDGTMMEARSPHLSGVAGFKELATVMNLLTDNGGYVTQSDGMHVHHDAPEFIDDVEKTYMLVQSWADNLHVIHQFVASNRRSSHACSRWQPSQIATLGMYKEGRGNEVNTYGNATTDFKQYGWTRHDLNISALREHGTIEIRLHEGCLDPVRAEAWIRFGQSLLNAIAGGRRKSPLRPVRDRDELLKVLRAPKVTQEILA